MTQKRLMRGAGRLLAIVLPGLVLALIAYGLITRAPDTSIDDSLARGRPTQLPRFSLPVLSSGSGRLSSSLRGPLADGRLSNAELRGRPYALNLWASWCGPCRDEAPVLERGFSGARVPIIGVDQQDVTGDGRAFERRYGLSYPLIRDRDGTVARRFGATGVPETFFVDAGGRVVGHVIGEIDLAGLRRGLRAAAAGRIVRGVQGGAQEALR